MDTRRALRRQRDTARAQRDIALQQLEDVAATAGSQGFDVKYLTRKLDAARDEIESLTRKLNRPASQELRAARREVLLARTANAELQNRLTGLQTANESLYRQLAGLRLTPDAEASR